MCHFAGTCHSISIQIDGVDILSLKASELRRQIGYVIQQTGLFPHMKVAANVAVVPVPDPRLGVLTEMERSKKTVPAQVRFVDVPGGTSSAQGLAKLRESDALAVVVRCFGADRAPTRRDRSSSPRCDRRA